MPTPVEIEDAKDILGAFCDQSDIYYSKAKEMLFSVMEDTQETQIEHALAGKGWEKSQRIQEVRNYPKENKTWHKIGYQKI